MSKELNGKSAVIVGYGREGQSVHQFFQANHPEIAVGIADRREVKPVVQGAVKMYSGEEYLARLADYDIIVRSPGIPSSTPQLQTALKEGQGITSETNIFFSECPGIIVGITGTKGKSTTSTLISDILKTTYPDVRLVGNIGNPALDYLPNADDKTLFVMELSSHQLEDTHYSPHIAVLLAIVPEHLSYHGSFDAYAQAKGNIVRFQSTPDMVIFNPANQTTNKIAQESQGAKIRFSPTDTSTNCCVKDGKVFVDGKFVINVEEIPLRGPGNLENVLAAVTVSNILGVTPKAIRQAIKEFKSLPHRLEYVGKKNGILFYNDSLATIPEATINALEALGADVETLLVGGFDRGLDFSVLGKYLASNKALKTVILFPTTGERIWAAVENEGENSELQRFNVSSMEEAVQIALTNTAPGKICLLSPASASFGMFKDYADRGSRFKKLVNS